MPAGCTVSDRMTNTESDLCFNLVLLLMSDSVFVIGASNVGYMIFNFLNLNAGWMHRLRSDDEHRIRSLLQPGSAADVRFGVRHRRLQRGLHDFQFPQSECRLDAPSQIG